MLKKHCERLCLFNPTACHVTLGAFHTASLSHQVIFPHGVVGSERCESASGTCFFVETASYLFQTKNNPCHGLLLLRLKFPLVLFHEISKLI